MYAFGSIKYVRKRTKRRKILVRSCKGVRKWRSKKVIVVLKMQVFEKVFFAPLVYVLLFSSNITRREN